MPRGWRMVRQWDDLNEALQFSIDNGLEGIVIKRSTAPYGEPWARVVL
jgi:ATP-dependent DNA ligase